MLTSALLTNEEKTDAQTLALETTHAEERSYIRSLASQVYDYAYESFNSIYNYASSFFYAPSSGLPVYTVDDPELTKLQGLVSQYTNEAKWHARDIFLINETIAFLRHVQLEVDEIDPNEVLAHNASYLRLCADYDRNFETMSSDDKLAYAVSLQIEELYYYKKGIVPMPDRLHSLTMKLQEYQNLLVSTANRDTPELTTLIVDYIFTAKMLKQRQIHQRPVDTVKTERVEILRRQLEARNLKISPFELLFHNTEIRALVAEKIRDMIVLYSNELLVESEAAHAAANTAAQQYSAKILDYINDTQDAETDNGYHPLTGNM